MLGSWCLDFLVILRTHHQPTNSRCALNMAPHAKTGREPGWPRSRSSGKVKDFSLLHFVQTHSGVHPTSYPMGTRGKVAAAWSWPLPPYTFMVYCLIAWVVKVQSKIATIKITLQHDITTTYFNFCTCEITFVFIMWLLDNTLWKLLVTWTT
jgi:hypothetical protein